MDTWVVHNLGSELGAVNIAREGVWIPVNVRVSFQGYV